MMQKCPKCGFVQPKDHYCAECGLNIDEYKPSRRAWHQRVAAKPLVLMAFICFGALLAGILRPPSQEPSLKALKPLHNTRTPSFKSNNLASSGDERQPAAQKPDPLATRAQAQPAVQPAVLGGPPPPPPPRPAVPSRVQLQFLEVPVSGLEAAYERGRELQGSANEKALALSFDKNLSDLRFMGGFVLPGGARQALTLKKSARFSFAGPMDESSEEPAGLALQFTMLSFDDNELAVELDASLRLPEGEQFYTGQLKEVYRLRPGVEVLLLTGFLPRNKDLNLPSLQGPLSLLQSEDFLNHSTEFVMLAQFR